jgi:hypothetical protein
MPPPQGSLGSRSRSLLKTMPTRFWLSILLAILAGIAVLLAKPTGRKQKSSVPWRGQIKPPPPPPIPQGPNRHP